MRTSISGRSLRIKKQARAALKALPRTPARTATTSKFFPAPGRGSSSAFELAMIASSMASFARMSSCGESIHRSEGYEWLGPTRSMAMTPVLPCAVYS